jgi:uncharacterized protein involved in exopolysaccharide biosynthesis
LTRKGKVTEHITAQTGVEYQLVLAVQQLEEDYAAREAVIHQRLDALSRQVHDLAGQVESLTSLLQRAVQP